MDNLVKAVLYIISNMRTYANNLLENPEDTNEANIILGYAESLEAAIIASGNQEFDNRLDEKIKLLKKV